MRPIMQSKQLVAVLVLSFLLPCLSANALASIGPVGDHSLVVAIDPKDPKTLYLNVYPVGVFKSTDGGESWCETGLHETTDYALVIDPNDSNTIYAGSGPYPDHGFIGGFYKSTDAGETWSGELTGRTNLTVSGIAVLIDGPAATRSRFLKTMSGMAWW